METELKTQEEIVKEGPANLQKLVLTKGGRFYLTNQRLIFEPHFINININREVSINLSDISKISKSWTRMLMIPLFPNSIKIRTKDNKTYGFVCYKRRSWIDAIEKARKS